MDQAFILFLFFVCGFADGTAMSEKAPLLDIPSELLGDVNKPYAD